MTLVSIDKFRSEVRAHRKPDAGIFRISIGQPMAAADGSRKVRFCFSDGSVDRMGDTIDPNGWDLTDFLRNPVALWAHDSSSPPIGKASNLAVEGVRLMGDIEFMPPETYDFADTIYRMVTGGYINACSVGFLPTDYDYSDVKRGIDFKSQQLLEISVVPVPANPNALVDARAKGIDTRPIVEWAERCLDEGGKTIITRKELERLRKAAKEPVVARRKPTPVNRSNDETDPADGGTVVGNCGRPIGAECGMKDVSECSIHGQGEVGVDANEEKDIAGLIRSEIAKAVGPAVAAALKAAAKPVRRASDDDDDDDRDTEEKSEDERPDVSEEHEKSIRMAHMHMKAMGEALDIADDHFDRAMKQLDAAKEGLDAAPPKSDDVGDPEGEKAARLRRARERKLKLLSV